MLWITIIKQFAKEINKKAFFFQKKSQKSAKIGQKGQKSQKFENLQKKHVLDPKMIFS